MVEKTRRELLAEAFDASMDEEDAGDEVALEESPGAGVGDETDESRVRDGGDIGERTDAGKESLEVEPGKTDLAAKSKKTKEVGKKPAPTEEERQEAEAAQRDAEGKEPKSAPVTDKAPNSWKPGVREHWSKIPAEARAEITRREKEIQVTLSQTANVRKFAGDFANVINPFAHLIRAQNSTPLQAVHNLMSTAAGLMVGSSQQKAAIVADIIQNYGVDCQELDEILAALATKNGGKVPNRQQSRPHENIPTWAQPLLEDNRRMKQAQAAHEEQMRQDADEEISKVETEPFFDDLRDDIADIMEISANRGRKMTVKQAYDKAVQLNPDISKLVAQQKVAKLNGIGKKVISRARRAASTISGSPMGRTMPGKKEGEKLSRREQLAAAWDDAVDR